MRTSILKLIALLFLTITVNTLTAQEVEPHLAQIILWRTGEFNHPNLRNRVILNDVQVANLSRKNFIKMIVPEGRYRMEVKDVEFITHPGSSEAGKWHHLDEGGEIEFDVRAGNVYNIQGIMHRSDPEADSAHIEEKLRYYIELQRYRGSYGHLQRELKARKENKNTGSVYTRVQILTTYNKKIEVCLIKNTDTHIEYIELASLISQVQTMDKSKVRSITLLP